MAIFFITFQVVPTTDNEHYDMIESAISHCWTVGYDPQSAFLKAQFYVSKDNWKIKNVENPPIEVTEEHLLTFCDLLESDTELAHFDFARNIKSLKEEFSKGAIYFFYEFLGREGKIKKPIILTSSSNQSKLSAFIDKQRELAKKENGRCLHFDSGNKCNEIIDAHSIQRRKSLSSIAEYGQIYVVAGAISDLKKNGEKLIYKKAGINKFSTFSGFCKHHDNELFKVIDESPLIPTEQQVFLYAYRSLCRAVFVKENSLELINSQIKHHDNKAVKELLNSNKIATVFGLGNLNRHKSEYDNSLKNKSYSDIKYVLFISKQKPSVVFSGLFWPDFDFLGRQLQNLRDYETKLELITICSAPMNDNNWGFLIAWHKNSSIICNSFMESLATAIYNKCDIGDLLFRLVISNCENLAISPQWWEKLSEDHKEKISSRVTSMAHPDIEIKHNYLMHGLEGISQWQFEEPISSRIGI